ncbi:hypothetical protein HPO_05767 [Hyphomonas polymorpha PS728]|uniref:Uncharacterized protein n=1 Tax=Hyphomonas polymorpha PS728 TaxID=1280954 RepID=A0A062VG95_9PROT|nr:hypothetical protein [Hyphomonas polymorpha]KCZ99419.1 hypothetical protein HPO_05767 [Hyphomonas polymorpha PS728]
MLHSIAISNHEPALADAPMICAAQKLLAFLLEHETIGLTQGKAFQRKFVHWAAAEFAWPGWEEEKLFCVNKVLNEYDFPPLEALHFVLLKLKLIRHEKLTCRLTKAGRALAGSPGDLFNEIAPFYLFQVDHAAWSRLSESRLDDWSLYLNLLHVQAARGVTCGALREALFGRPEPAGSYDRVPGMIWNQVLRPLCWVGLLADITTSEHAHIEDRRYIKTPLWAKAFEYSPSVAEVSVLAAHRFRRDHSA